MIKVNADGTLSYFDKNGVEIHEGDTVRYASGREMKVYLTDHDELGVDATNPPWIASGRAEPCDFGIYPFEEQDLAEIVRV